MNAPRSRWLLLLALAVLLPGPVRGDSQREADRLRVLLVLDTDDKMGATWGLDGANVKAVLEAALKRQQLDGRYTIDVLTGKDVTPDKVLQYYAGLNVGSNEALLFYYSGHGGYHRNKGHFLALTSGPLFRKDLHAAMAKHGPRLAVVLTDCCSNYAGGALAEEPAGQVRVIRVNLGAKPKAREEEPPPVVLALDRRTLRRVSSRPDVSALLPGRGPVREQEPPVERVAALRGAALPAQPRAAREEPPSVRGGRGPGVVLQTGDGPLPLQVVLDRADGRLLRDLLYRHGGVVDVNGCKKGALSHGTGAWGGSLFTIALLSLQKDRAETFDANRDGVVAWSEFFPAMRRRTEEAGQRVGRGNIRQVPEAYQFGKLLGK